MLMMREREKKGNAPQSAFLSDELISAWRALNLRGRPGKVKSLELHQVGSYRHTRMQIRVALNTCVGKSEKKQKLSTKAKELLDYTRRGLIGDANIEFL
jgi:hypothetical protein